MPKPAARRTAKKPVPLKHVPWPDLEAQASAKGLTLHDHLSEQADARGVTVQQHILDLHHAAVEAGAVAPAVDAPGGPVPGSVDRWNRKAHGYPA